MTFNLLKFWSFSKSPSPLTSPLVFLSLILLNFFLIFFFDFFLNFFLPCNIRRTTKPCGFIFLNFLSLVKGVHCSLVACFLYINYKSIYQLLITIYLSSKKLCNWIETCISCVRAHRNTWYKGFYSTCCFTLQFVGGIEVSIQLYFALRCSNYQSRS